MAKRKQGLVPVPRLGVHKNVKEGAGPGSGSQGRKNPNAVQSPTEGGRTGGSAPRASGEKGGSQGGKAKHTRTGNDSLEPEMRQSRKGRATHGASGAKGSEELGGSTARSTGNGRGVDERRGNRARQNQRIYRQAATALSRYLAADASKRGGASLKSLTLAPQNVAKGATHALTCQTLKLLPLLQLVLAMAGILEAPAGAGQGPGSAPGTREARGGARGRGRGGAKAVGGGAGRGLWAEMVYVVAYDVLFGNVQAAVAAGLGAQGGASLGLERRAKRGADGAPAGRSSTKAVPGGPSAEVRAVLSRRSALRAALARLVVREGVASVDHLVLRLCGPGVEVGVRAVAGVGKGGQAGAEGQQGSGGHSGGTAFPRYARVNTLKTSLEEVLRALSGEVRPGLPQEAQEDKLACLREGLTGIEPTPRQGNNKAAEEGKEGKEAGGREGGGECEKLGMTDGKGAMHEHQQEGNRHAQHTGLGASRQGTPPQSPPGAPEQDPLIPNVLRFPPGTDLHAHPLVSRGHVILQGRASCIPAHVLSPPSGAHVLDACAAPGNKTTHLAAIMGGRGKVTACERDPKRAQLLRASVERAGAGGMVEVVVGDFLRLDPREECFAGVSAVLVDPSCSGSGTAVSRMDHLLPSSRQQAMGHEQAPAQAPTRRGMVEGEGEAEGNKVDWGEGAWERDVDEGNGVEGQEAEEAGYACGNIGKVAPTAGLSAGASSSGRSTGQAPGGPAEQQHRARLERLAGFQEAALRHALGFPAAERVVYSTCSVEERENEGVVVRVLGHARGLGFQLAPALPGWPRRGLDKYEFSEMVLRTRPEEDLMDGFFVALFTRDLNGKAQTGGGNECGEGSGVHCAGAGAGISKAQKKRRKAKTKRKLHEAVA